MLIGRNEFDSLENSGAITVKATADPSDEAVVSAIGLIVEGSVIGSGFENSGTIDVVASADSSDSSARADASGINLYDVLFSGDFTNSGSVSVTAEAHGYYTGAVTAYGMFRGEPQEAELSHSRIIPKFCSVVVSAMFLEIQRQSRVQSKGYH